MRHIRVENNYNNDVDVHYSVLKNHWIYFSSNKTNYLLYDAIYFDNEGHNINYVVTYTDSSIVLTSEIVPDLARFRLSYVKIDNKKMNVRFEIALPPDHDKFVTYLEGKALKKD